MTLDRLLGGIVALFGLFLLTYAIPANVKSASGMFVFPNPALFPQIAAVLMVVLGLMQAALVRTKTELPGWKAFGMFLVVAGATLAAMLLIRLLGYLPVAFALMVAVCLIGRERRPLWLGIVIVAVPVGTWLLFEQVLGRPLP